MQIAAPQSKAIHDFFSRLTSEFLNHESDGSMDRRELQRPSYVVAQMRHLSARPPHELMAPPGEIPWPSESQRACEELTNESEKERGSKLPLTGCDGLPEDGRPMAISSVRQRAVADRNGIVPPKAAGKPFECFPRPFRPQTDRF